MSAAWVTRLRRTIDNGSCTLAHIDGALRLRAVTADEHAELTAYWHEVNDPPPVIDPPVDVPDVEPVNPVTPDPQDEP